MGPFFIHCNTMESSFQNTQLKMDLNLRTAMTEEMQVIKGHLDLHPSVRLISSCSTQVPFMQD
jgi:hypothetical protein